MEDVWLWNTNPQILDRKRKTFYFQWKVELRVHDVIAVLSLMPSLPPASATSISLPRNFAKHLLSIFCLASLEEKKDTSTLDSNSNEMVKGTDANWAPARHFTYVSSLILYQLSGVRKQEGHQHTSLIQNSTAILSVPGDLFHMWRVTLCPILPAENRGVLISVSQVRIWSLQS